MNKDIIKGNWHQVKGMLKKQWGKLTDDQILNMKGSSEELTGALQKTYGCDKDKAQKEIKQFIDENEWTE